MFPFHKGDPRPAVAISEIERDIHTQRERVSRADMPVKSYLPIFEGGGGGTRGGEVGTLDQYILGTGSKVVAW